jgi:thiol:disulfide interchange protein DsbD
MGQGLALLAGFLGELESYVGGLAETLAGSVGEASDPLRLALFFGAGVLASLTPCVYPMIPIVVTYMGGAESTSMAEGAGREGRRGRVFVRALLYVGGMAVVYTALGLAAILLGKPFGSLTQSFWGYAIVAGVIGVFALSMLGLFEIRVPSFLLNRVGTGPKQGFAGSVVMGASSAIVAAPCAAPIVLPLVTLVAQEQRILFGGMLMLSFSLGLGLLFLVLAVSSGLAASMPRPGMWMVTLKKGVGILMLGLAGLFLWWGIQML